MNLLHLLRRRSWALTAIFLATTGIVLVGHFARPTENASAPPVETPSLAGLPSAESFFRYTPPVPLSRLANEWEPQRALVMSISFNESRTHSRVARYQIDLLAAASPVVDIYVLGELNHHKAYAHFLAQLEQHPAADTILSRTHFVDSRDLMRWTRDFGPVFGFDREENLVAIDFVYRDLMWQWEGELQQKQDPERVFFTMQGDAMPADLVAHLQRHIDRPVQITRPPLSMDGGDFVTDGQGNVFVSTRTLARNGGDRAELQRLFQSYFGAKHVHILETLPGSTVHHLDMILKFLDEETLLLPDYQPQQTVPLNRYQSALIDNVQKTLKRNEDYLRRHFPHYRILKVPMPSILFNSAGEILEEARDEFVRVVALEQKILTAQIYDELGPAEKDQLAQVVFEQVQKETGLSDFRTFEGFDAILRRYGQMSLRDYFRVHAESVTRYRSYLNSVFLHNESGDQTFIVPRFTSSDRDEVQRLQKWEAQVAQALRQVWPQAKIQWVNCDAMVADMGFIHCTTLTVPAGSRG